MKTIPISFEQSEYNKLKVIKEYFGLTWKELISEGAIELSKQINDPAVNDLLKKVS